MTQFNHMYDLAFEVISNDENGDDVTPDMLRHALLRRIIGLDEDREWLNATSICDSYEVEAMESGSSLTDMLEAAYLAGFASIAEDSSEAENAEWCADRDQAVAAISRQGKQH